MRFEGCGISTADLIALANEGLTKAALRFEPCKNKFITYAVWWIKQPIFRDLSQKELMVVPSNRADERVKFLKCDRHLAQFYGRHPTELEMRDELDIDQESYDDMQTLWQKVLSLDDAVFDEEDGPILSEAISNEEPLPDETIKRREQAAMLNKIMGEHISEREQVAVKLYFGFGLNGNRRTLEEIAEQLGVSKERVRQIIEEAKRKLRMGFKLRHLGFANLV